MTWSAITGAAGLGKSSLCAALIPHLATVWKTPRHVQLDNFLKARADRPGLTGYESDSYRWDHLSGALAALEYGPASTFPCFDQSTGNVWGQTSEFAPGHDLVLLDGIIALEPRIRAKLASVVFIGASKEVCIALRADADGKRGYARAEAHSVERTERYYQAFVKHLLPYATYAEIQLICDASQGLRFTSQD